MTANKLTESVNFYILPMSDKEIIEELELSLMGEYTAELAKNEILAKRGYAFDEPYIHEYFSNMSWYKSDESIKDIYNNLNEIERENIRILEEHISGYQRDYFAPEEYDIDSGMPYYVQVVSKDLDGNGEEEEIKVSFYGYFCEIEITDVNGNYYNTEYLESNIIPGIKFADFDVTDKLLQFYIEAEGPSADPSTQIYSFDGNKIISNLNMVGYITRYNGISGISSFDIYSVNCYFDLYNGLTPLPKENIIGTVITRGNIELFKKPETGYTLAIIADYLTDSDYEYDGEYKSDYIGVIPGDTPLLVTDIEFGNAWFENGELYYVPWLKVKTPDETEGWFCLVYGD